MVQTECAGSLCWATKATLKNTIFFLSPPLCKCWLNKDEFLKTSINFKEGNEVFFFSPGKAILMLNTSYHAVNFEDGTKRSVFILTRQHLIEGSTARLIQDLIIAPLDMTIPKAG